MISICKFCKKEFKHYYRKRIFCSLECFYKTGHSIEWKKKMSKFRKRFIKNNPNNTAFKKGHKPSWAGKNRPNVSGKLHWNWKEGIRRHPAGYIEIFSPNHPYAHTHRKSVLEHRLIMEKHLGRYLTPNEQVHHINSNKADNRIKNLKLFSCNSEHIKLHPYKRNKLGQFF